MGRGRKFITGMNNQRYLPIIVVFLVSFVSATTLLKTIDVAFYISKHPIISLVMRIIFAIGRRI